MKQIHCPGTGESYCTTSRQLRVLLLNTPIEHCQMIEFYKHLQTVFPELPKDYSIYFSARETERQLGIWHGTGIRREILINRRCVQVFLHEISHAVSYHCFKSCEHDWTFGKTLDRVTAIWTTLHPISTT